MTSTVTQPVPSRQAGLVNDVLDPEVPEWARRRTYTAKYKRDVLAEYDAADRAGRGALLRREGLYSSSISAWRDQRATRVQSIVKHKDRILAAIEHNLPNGLIGTDQHQDQTDHQDGVRVQIPPKPSSPSHYSASAVTDPYSRPGTHACAPRRQARSKMVPCRSERHSVAPGEHCIGQVGPARSRPSLTHSDSDASINWTSSRHVMGCSVGSRRPSAAWS